MNKFNILLLLLFLSFFAYSEVVGVPNYNYSVYPLEGWELQPYEEDSMLSWISDDSSIVFSITSWSGETFSDIDDMFSVLTAGFNGKGNFAKFEYLGMNAAIGEVEFSAGTNDHKGWMIFIDGSEFDYYLTSFSMLESYESSNSSIFSILDSFSYGDEGMLHSGPITTFFDLSPNKEPQNYVIDFFDNDLIITSSELDFESAQTVIEREAQIMSYYSNSPDLFYKAWVRYYKLIFRDNYQRLEPLYQSLYPYFADDKYSDYELTELLMFWIQGYTYERSLESASDLLNPIESALRKTGDCDSRSLVLGILLHRFGIESILLTSEKVQHALLAVNLEGEGTTYEYMDKKYLMVELTAKMLIGEISEKHTDPSLWTPVEMEYTNGF